MRLQHRLILLRLVHLQVIEELAALRDLAEKTATRGEILLVLGQVLAQKVDLLREDGDLHRRGACVGLVDLVLRNETFLRGALEHGKGMEGNVSRQSQLP